ncbi:hypothetical protein BU14_1658s0001 [Porphyra umbilicalis]|uniref:RBR-type E3 ubiquitin transferase n=1 Tax=Porphyra umbilicalis TaxID=2786 RepID=A0A1X6NL85_PORUM|nr:hypothetical protein BU14_1658s0001 [Porphyra umbilicalis]|eukprot:OSX69290.1 hypothetical protein BU14_1658s0001 [Porphyra umbilicalis]
MADAPEDGVVMLRVDSDGHVWDGSIPVDPSVAAAVRHSVRQEAAKQLRLEELRAAGWDIAGDFEGLLGGGRNGPRGGDWMQRPGSEEGPPADDSTCAIVSGDVSGSVPGTGAIPAAAVDDGGGLASRAAAAADLPAQGLFGTTAGVHWAVTPGLLVLPDEWRHNELCTVCFGRFSPNRMVTLASCTHAFCAGCYNSYLTSEIFSGKHDRLICLHGGCLVGATDADVERLVSPRTYRKLLYFRSRDGARARGEEGARWCAAEGCWARLHPAAVTIALAGATGGGGGSMGGLPLGLPSRRSSSLRSPRRPSVWAAAAMGWHPDEEPPPPDTTPPRVMVPAAAAATAAAVEVAAAAEAAGVTVPRPVGLPALAAAPLVAAPSAVGELDESAPAPAPSPVDGDCGAPPAGGDAPPPPPRTDEPPPPSVSPQHGVVTCHDCGTRNCVLCETLSTPDHACRRPTVPLTVRKQAVSFWRWAALHTRACPRCRVRIQKDSGCSHVTCSRCGAYFCYRCLGYLPTCCAQAGRQCVCVRTANAAVYSGLAVVGVVFSPLLVAAAVIGGVPYGAYRLSRRRRRRVVQRQAAGRGADGQAGDCMVGTGPSR